MWRYTTSTSDDYSIGCPYIYIYKMDIYIYIHTIQTYIHTYYVDLIYVYIITYLYKDILLYIYIQQMLGTILQSGWFYMRKGSKRQDMGNLNKKKYCLYWDLYCQIHGNAIWWPPREHGEWLHFKTASWCWPNAATKYVIPSWQIFWHSHGKIHHAIKNGKPSISMGHLLGGAALLVTSCYTCHGYRSSYCFTYSWTY